jgi:hypothetical protein
MKKWKNNLIMETGLYGTNAGVETWSTMNAEREEKYGGGVRAAGRLRNAVLCGEGCRVKERLIRRVYASYEGRRTTCMYVGMEGEAATGH